VFSKNLCKFFSEKIFMKKKVKKRLRFEDAHMLPKLPLLSVGKEQNMVKFSPAGKMRGGLHLELFVSGDWTVTEGAIFTGGHLKFLLQSLVTF
jgi:hypothetical protein